MGRSGDRVNRTLSRRPGDRADRRQQRLQRAESQREKREKRERPVSPRAFAVRVGLILLAFIVIYVVASHSTFKVREFDISGNHIVADADIISLSGISEGDDLFQTDVNAAADQIALHVMIDDVDVRVRPFHKILIEVEEKNAVAGFVVDDLYYYIDETKVIVGESETIDERLPLFIDFDIPAFVSIGLPLEDPKIDTDLAIAAAAGDLFTGYEVQISAVSESENNIYINEVQIRLGTAGRLEDKMNVCFELIHSMSDQKLASLEYIDVSIPDEPVLKERPVEGEEEPADGETTSTTTKKEDVKKNKRDTTEAE